ncbi:hypothetical protein ACCC92_10945 [Mucilaginibacter sp. Mucisp84]|uniref:hypothetical protein n=1 Tax=Mucilaginibacter sp. Mucisp84 TaxID=3243058 RepID=UPI0039A6BD1F
MLQLISKLQHNTYEKSEYSDEQLRNVDETIQVIKDFPWDAERALTDIQLTGPSVVIQDNNLNYLKLGLYFNSKFCVYYLDNGNHLYEYHASTIDKACDLVKDFFEQTLNLSSFEKHFFNIGNQPHFITSDFIYRVNPARIFVLAAFFSIYLLFAISVFCASALHIGGGSYPIALLLIILGLGIFIGSIASVAIKGRNQYLQISRGNHIFYYGIDEKHIKEYNKADVAELAHRTATSDRNMGNVQIRFKNGEFIQPKMLIHDMDLIQKFPENLGIKIIYPQNSLFKRSQSA